MKKNRPGFASKTQREAAYAERAHRRRRRWLLRGAVTLAVSAPLVGFGVYRFVDASRSKHDLTVIGIGTPTVVQVFDAHCAECRQLRDRVEAAIAAHPAPIQHRLADRSTAEGGLFASRHQAEHLSLFFFAADGSLRGRETGMASQTDVALALRSFFPDRTVDR